MKRIVDRTVAAAITVVGMASTAVILLFAQRGNRRKPSVQYPPAGDVPFN